MTHVLIDLEDQSDVAGAIMALPGLAEVYRDDRFVILRAAPCIAERSCPVSATGSDEHVGGDAGSRRPPAARTTSGESPVSACAASAAAAQAAGRHQQQQVVGRVGLDAARSGAPGRAGSG